MEKLCKELEIKPEELFGGIEAVNQNDMENHSFAVLNNLRNKPHCYRRDMENHSFAVLNNVYSDAHITINHLSDKMIELYEEKIRLLEERIEELKDSAGSSKRK